MKSSIAGLEYPRDGQRSILPAVLITLDEEVSPLGGEVVMQMSRWHPDALPFFAAVQMSGQESDARRYRQLRVAFEAVTDLPARQRVLRDGFFVQDKLRVFIAFSAGWRRREGGRREAAPGSAALKRVLEAVHRVSADFFDQTLLEVNTLVFLPDLADSWDRDWRYREAYQRLREIDQAGDASRALAHRTYSSLDFRWFVDCRTQTGAHAGGRDHVLPSVAEMVAVLLDGRRGGPAAAASEAGDQLRALVRNRQSAYSTFGVATLFHYPRVLVRSLAARAAELYLARYAGVPLSDTDEQGLTVLDDAVGATGAAPDLSQVLVDLGAEIRRSFSNAVNPEFRTARRLDSELRRRQGQHRASVLAAVDALLEREVREVLAKGGLSLARQVVRALGLLSLEGDDLLRVPPGVARGDLRTTYLDLVREFMGTSIQAEQEDALRAERARLEQEGGALDRIEEIDRELQAAAVSRRRLDALLDPEADPDRIEAQLEVVERERPTASDAAGTVEEAAPPRGGWIRRILYRVLRPRRRTPQPLPPPTTALPAAWHVAESLRWLRGYEELLERLGHSIAEHQRDVEYGLGYYGEVHRSLRHWLTRGSRFYVPVLQAEDMAQYADEYVPRILGQLRAEWDWWRMARCFGLPPVEVAPFESRLVVRLQGFDPTLSTAAETAGAVLLRETVASALAARSSRDPDLPWNVLRMLIEGAQPLARPRPAGEQQPETSRWLYGDAQTRAFFRSHEEAALLLAEREVADVDNGDPYGLMLCSSLHGFPAHALRKTFRFRADYLVHEGPVPEREDVVPADVALEDESSRLFNLVVLAKALKVLDGSGDSFVLPGIQLPKDLLLATDTLAFLIDNRKYEHDLRSAVHQKLKEDEGLGWLREASERQDLTEVEREIVLDTLTEMSHPTFTWEMPIYGAGGAHDA